MASRLTVPSNSVSGSDTAFFFAPAAEKCWASIMATPASLLADGEQAVRRPRHRPAHEQQIPLRVHLHDLEPQLGEVPGAHVAGHPLPLDDPGRVGARRDRARLAVPGVAVGLRAACEVIAVHDALEATAFGHAGHLHQLAGLENRYGDGVARLRRRVADDVEAVQHARRRLEPALLGVAEQ